MLQPLQRLDAGHERRAVDLVHEKRALVRLGTAQAAHHADDAEQVELEGAASIGAYQALKHGDVVRRVLPLEQLGEVEGFMDLDGLLDQHYLARVQGLDGWNLRLHVLHEHENHVFGRTAVALHRLQQRSCFADAPDGQEDDHRMGHLLRKVAPSDKALYVDPQLPRKLALCFLVRGERLVVAAEQVDHTDDCAHRELALMLHIQAIINPTSRPKLPECLRQTLLQIGLLADGPRHEPLQEFLDCFRLCRGGREHEVLPGPRR
mmetsp:Transcript_83369/g.240891  ORF Transcript_83369/g.240891 Transcript_83369/m.240891 type:complete len:263 (+) Transcript_83369:796-1584(+)